MNPLRYVFTGLTLLYLFINSSLVNASDSQLLFSLTSESKARLGVVNKDNHVLDLEISDKNGEVFYSKSVQSGQNFFQLLSLTDMPDGQYQVILSGYECHYQKEFIIAKHKAELIFKTKVQEPTFQLINNNTLAVSYSNANGKTVNIFFEINDEVVFEDRNISDRIVNKKYSLKQLPKGAYSVKLYSDGNIFSYPLVLK